MDAVCHLDARVAQLLRAMTRMFYSDEHVAIMDMLVQKPYWRDVSGSLNPDAAAADSSGCDLERCGLPARQVRGILNFFVGEGLVQTMRVTECTPGFAGCADPAAHNPDQPTAADPTNPSGASGAAGDPASPSTATVRASKKSVAVYYINPGYVVDVIQYRVACIDKALSEAVKSRASDRFLCLQCRAAGARSYVYMPEELIPSMMAFAAVEADVLQRLRGTSHRVLQQWLTASQVRALLSSGLPDKARVPLFQRLLSIHFRSLGLTRCEKRRHFTLEGSLFLAGPCPCTPVEAALPESSARAMLCPACSSELVLDEDAERLRKVQQCAHLQWSRQTRDWERRDLVTGEVVESRKGLRSMLQELTNVQCFTPEAVVRLERDEQGRVVGERAQTALLSLHRQCDVSVEVVVEGGGRGARARALRDSAGEAAGAGSGIPHNPVEREKDAEVFCIGERGGGGGSAGGGNVTCYCQMAGAALDSSAALAAAVLLVNACDACRTRVSYSDDDSGPVVLRVQGKCRVFRSIYDVSEEEMLLVMTATEYERYYELASADWHGNLGTV